MRRIESQRRAPDSCFLRFVGFAYPAPRHETELCRADHRMGVPKGPCGVLHVRARQIEAARVSFGTWLVQFDFNRHFDKLCERAGVRRIRVHDLRRSCATLLYDQGVSIEHADGSTECMDHTCDLPHELHSFHVACSELRGKGTSDIDTAYQLLQSAREAKLQLSRPYLRGCAFHALPHTAACLVAVVSYCECHRRNVELGHFS